MPAEKNASPTAQPHPAQPGPDRPVDTRVRIARQQLARAEEAAKATTATKTASTADRPKPILGVDRLRGAEFERNVHVAVPGQADTVDDMLDPGYWAHVAPKFKPYDKIEVRAEDGTYYAELLVLACDRAWAKVHVLTWHELSSADIALTQAAAASSLFEVRFRPGPRWHVVRKSDSQTMFRDGKDRAEAESWVREYVKTIER